MRTGDGRLSVLVWMVAIVAVRMSIAAHVGGPTVMLLSVVRRALILRMPRFAVVCMTFVVNLVVLVIEVMVLLVLVVVPIVVMALVPVRSLVPPIGMAIPIRVLTTPLAIAFFWVSIAITEIRMILGMVVTVIITLGMA
jgi:hypothetical protein